MSLNRELDHQPPIKFAVSFYLVFITSLENIHRLEQFTQFKSYTLGVFLNVMFHTTV